MESYGLPYDRAKSRAAYIQQVKARIDPSSIVGDVVRRMVDEFASTVDIEQYCPHLEFDNSYTTLHDHQIGAEILKQTDIVARFEAFAGRGRMKELFGGEDDQLSGVVAVHFANFFASQMESAMRSQEYKPQLVKLLATKFKSSDWWKANETRVSKVLKKNRDQLNKIRSVQES